MRSLAPPPAAIVSPSGEVAEGSFAGPLPRVDLAPLRRSRLHRVTHRKKWIYAAAAADDLFVALAVVDLGYASKAFGFACDASGLLADTSVIGPPRGARVSDVTGDGAFARFRSIGGAARIERRGARVELEARLGVLDVAWSMSVPVGSPALSAVARLGAAGVNATEKRALLPAEGEVRVGGRARRFTNALGGYDYTHGYLERHTAWHWGYLLGEAEGGTKVAMNLVRGFVGEPECGVWIGDALYPVGEGRFERAERGADDPRAPWRITTTCGAVDLTLTPWGAHRETTNLGLVRARFVQPCGPFQGTIRAGGREHRIVRALGVAEEQDVLW